MKYSPKKFSEFRAKWLTVRSNFKFRPAHIVFIILGLVALFGIGSFASWEINNYFSNSSVTSGSVSVSLTVNDNGGGTVYELQTDGPGTSVVMSPIWGDINYSK